MEHEHSAEDLEVARILRMLPHLVWEAQHPRPSTHNLRWGSRKRRSAGNDETRPPPTHSPAAAPPPLLPRPPLHHPAAPPHAVGTPNEKRIGDDSYADTSEEKATATAYTGRGSDPPVPRTSSPETPLDFCPSGEEPDAEAKHRPTPSCPSLYHHQQQLQRRRQRQLLLDLESRHCKIPDLNASADEDLAWI